jgi:hypothetical protein
MVQLLTDSTGLRSVLDLLPGTQLEFDHSPFTITDVVQESMTSTKFIVTFSTNTAKIIPYDAAALPVLKVEVSTNSGGSWATTEQASVSLNLTGTTQTATYTTGAIDYSTGIWVRVRWSHPALGATNFSAASNIFTPTWDYFDPATVFPSMTYTLYSTTKPSGGGSSTQGSRTIVFSGTAPTLNVPSKRFEWTEDTNDFAGEDADTSGPPFFYVTDLVNPELQIRSDWPDENTTFTPTTGTLVTRMLMSPAPAFKCL